MEKQKTEKKMSITINSNVYQFLEENFENKSQYIEYLIYKDIKDNGLLIKEVIL